MSGPAGTIYALVELIEKDDEGRHETRPIAIGVAWQSRSGYTLQIDSEPVAWTRALPGHTWPQPRRLVLSLSKT